MKEAWMSAHPHGLPGRESAEAVAGRAGEERYAATLLREHGGGVVCVRNVLLPGAEVDFVVASRATLVVIEVCLRPRPHVQSPATQLD